MKKNSQHGSKSKLKNRAGNSRRAGRKPGPQPLTKEQRIDLYKHFLADPEQSGSMKKTEFAKKVLLLRGNNGSQQLCKYSKDPGFWDDVHELFTDHYLQGQLPEINRQVVKKAKDGSQWAIELVLKMAKRLEDRIGEGPKMVLPDNLIVTIRKNESRSAPTKDSGD